MKTIKAYEVGGKVFRDKKEAEKAENVLAERKKQEELVKQFKAILSKMKSETVYDLLLNELRDREFKAFTGKDREKCSPCPGGWRKESIDISRKIQVDRVREKYGKDAADEVANRWAKEDASVDSAATEAQATGKPVVTATQTPKFKKGDRVKVNWSNPEVNGRHGTVMNTDVGVNMCSVDVEGMVEGKREWHLRHADIELLPAYREPKFKVGDRVKVVDFKGLNGNKGKIVKVDNTPLPYEVHWDTPKRHKDKKGYTLGHCFADKHIALI